MHHNQNIKAMFEDGNKEFAGSRNVWLKRMGLIILLVGLFPELAVRYWDKIELVWKLLFGAFLVSYVILTIKRFIKDIFNPNQE